VESMDFVLVYLWIESGIEEWIEKMFDFGVVRLFQILRNIMLVVLMVLKKMGGAIRRNVMLFAARLLLSTTGVLLVILCCISTFVGESIWVV